MDKPKKSHKNNIGGAVFFIPAGIFIGLAFGLLVNNIPIGIFVGFGIGFLLFGFIIVLYGNT